MKFRTSYLPKRSGSPLDVERPMLMLGSCFSDNIGGILRAGGWDVSVNPCGTLFHALSVARIIRFAVSPEAAPRMNVTDAGRWFSWDFPTAFSGDTEEEARDKIASCLAEVREYIMKSQALILTLGTSMVYCLEEDPVPVANCHKMPQRMFVRRMLSIEEQTSALKGAISLVRECNPGLRVILTVSPVRYLSEGFPANTRSKARLALVCESLERECGAEYFPAYEILTDDLRSYRFYAGDLIHPSGEASEYISEIFADTYLDSRGKGLLSECRGLRRRLEHRETGGDSDLSEKFREETRRLRDAFLALHPGMKV